MKFLHLIKDKRNPIFFIPNLLKRNSLSGKLSEIKVAENTEISFALTFDVEYDIGSAGSKTTEYVGPFLKKTRKLFKNMPVTFFIQGNLIVKYKNELKALENDGHELGLHGWAHEPWGESWFIKDKLPSIIERDELLKKSISTFDGNGLKRPISFRAPNMVIDNDSLELLNRHGFKVDSSAPSYAGHKPLITKVNSVMEIPVSADPVPEIRRNFGASYKVLGTYSLKNNTEEISDNIIKFQLMEGQQPLLVFLSHPWEFFANEKFNYCSENNFPLLFNYIENLSKNRKINFVTMRNAAGL